MRNRGQVTIFIVLAIIILAVIFLFLFLRNRIYMGPATAENLMKEFPQISSHIEECLSSSAAEASYLLAEQGGYTELKEGTYKRVNNIPINYLCYDIPAQKNCMNRMLTKTQLQQELKKAIMPKLSSCLNIKSFEKAGYTLEYGSLPEPSVSIGIDTITVLLNYPITIKKDTAQASLSSFSSTVDLPLGRLYSSANDIIKLESLFGTFDAFIYSLTKSKITNKLYTITQKPSSSDKLYILKISNVPTEKSPLIFQFLIQGEA